MSRPDTVLVSGGSGCSGGECFSTGYQPPFRQMSGSSTNRERTVRNKIDSEILHAKIKTIFCTGGAGYIGSHTCVELLQQGHDVVVIDNLCNSSADSLERVREITGKDLRFHQADIRDSEALTESSPNTT